MTSKLLPLVTLTFVAATTTALAGDVGYQANEEMALVSPEISTSPQWGGFYLGAHGGYGQTDTSGVFDTSGNSPFATYSTFDISGSNYGLQGGYNFGYNGLILGVEADYSWSGMQDSFVDGEASRQGVETEYFGSVRGRLGAASNNMMVYMTGGYGFTRTALSVEDGADGLTFDSQGFVFGAGLEYAITPRITLKGEWLRMAFNHNIISSDHGAGGSSGVMDGLIDGDDDDHFSLSGHDIIRVGLNFKLGGMPGSSGSMAASNYQPATNGADFSGFYVGALVGYDNADVGGQFDESDGSPIANFALFDMAAANGGIQVGYDFQSGNLLYGIAADYTWTNSGDSFVDTDGDLQELSIDNYGTLQGRFGVVSNNLLVFASAGIGWSKLDLTVEDGAGSLSLEGTGMVFGGGLEWAFAKNYSLKVEYLRIGLDEGISAESGSLMDGLPDGDDGDHLSFDGIDQIRLGFVARF